MQLCIRGRYTYVLECEESASIGQIKDRIASLESIKASEVRLYAAGVPMSNHILISAFDTHIKLTVGLRGGKVYGSLVRAGKVRAQTPKVEKQEKKKKKTGCAKKRMQSHKIIVNVPTSFEPKAESTQSANLAASLVANSHANSTAVCGEVRDEVRALCGRILSK